jgi:hypothetical protein
MRVHRLKVTRKILFIKEGILFWYLCVMRLIFILA